MSPSDDLLASFPVLALYPDFEGSFDALRSLLSRLDRTETLVWCARLNLFQSVPWAEEPEVTRSLLPLFFSEQESKAMYRALKRARKPRRDYLSLLDRPYLLDLIKWVALLSPDAPNEPADFAQRETRRQLVTAALHTVDLFIRRTFQTHAGPYLDQDPNEATASFGPAVVREIEWFRSPDVDLRYLIGRSRLLMGKEFFGELTTYRAQFESLAGMSVDQYVACVGHMLKLTILNVQASARQAPSEVGLLDPAGPDGSDPGERATLDAYLRLESQSAGELAQALLRRLPDPHVGKSTPLDSSSLRLRPFLRAADGRTIAIDFGFLVDKLSVGPLFHLVSAAKSGKEIEALFRAFGQAVEAYALGLFRAIVERQETGTYDGFEGSPHGTSGKNSIEIADVCLRSGSDLLMVETKTAVLGERLTWQHADGAYLRTVKERYGSGARKKGVAQLARSILGLSRATLVPDKPDLFASVERIFPVLLTNDEVMADPFHSGLLGQELLSCLEVTGRSTPGFTRVGPFEVAPLAVMTLADLETFEGTLCSSNLIRLIEVVLGSNSDAAVLFSYLLQGAFRQLGLALDSSSHLGRAAAELSDIIEALSAPIDPRDRVRQQLQSDLTTRRL